MGWAAVGPLACAIRVSVVVVLALVLALVVVFFVVWWGGVGAARMPDVLVACPGSLPSCSSTRVPRDGWCLGWWAGGGEGVVHG